ncbi:MAG: conotoxin [Capnocytophaga sp.]|nr:conotoxin [Capnocytophaga sp.]
MSKILLTIAVVLATTFAFAKHNDEGGKQAKNEPKKETNAPEKQKAQDSEALYCEVTKPDGTRVVCVICNCERLSKGNEKKTQDSVDTGDKENKEPID